MIDSTVKNIVVIFVIGAIITAASVLGFVFGQESLDKEISIPVENSTINKNYGVTEAINDLKADKKLDWNITFFGDGNVIFDIRLSNNMDIRNTLTMEEFVKFIQTKQYLNYIGRD